MEKPRSHLRQTLRTLAARRASSSGRTAARIAGTRATSASAMRSEKSSSRSALSKGIWTSSWIATGMQPWSTASSKRADQPSPGSTKQKRARASIPP
jgi:hypothetical protein